MTFEIIASIHIHTKYSDGTKLHKEIAKIAAECGLDAVIITDHNIYVKGLDGYQTHKGQSILVITGEEIHDKNRKPQKNHLLAIGVDRTHVEFASDPQLLIDQIKQDGGLTFIAHGYDPALLEFNEDDLSWVDWSVKGFTGMEIWNNLSEFKFHFRNKLQAAFLAFFPQFMAVQPPKPIIERWDSLLNSGRQVVGIGGADAHTLIYHIGPFIKEVFPYRYHFRTVNTHLLLKQQPSGSEKEDTRLVLDALRAGRAFVANDSIKPTRGFRFTLDAGNQTFEMGEKVKFRNNLILKVNLPYPADCHLMKNGIEIAHFERCIHFEYPVSSSGVYRVECYRSYWFKKRGWIFSNPIYIE